MTSNDDLSPLTNPDAQEALSRKYADGVVHLIRLRSGRVAVFDTYRQLRAIKEAHEPLDDALSIPHIAPARITLPTHAPTIDVRGINTGDLDL